MNDWLPKFHRILEKGSMAFQPFGKHPNGHNIRDVSGVTVRANVEFLEDLVNRTKASPAGTHAVEELIRRLNERIQDSTYHVTQEFLRNPWNSYSYKFVIFLAEFCVILSEDEKFHIQAWPGKIVIAPRANLGQTVFHRPDLFHVSPLCGKIRQGRPQTRSGVFQEWARDLAVAVEREDHPTIWAIPQWVRGAYLSIWEACVGTDSITNVSSSPCFHYGAFLHGGRSCLLRMAYIVDTATFEFLALANGGDHPQPCRVQLAFFECWGPVIFHRGRPRFDSNDFSLTRGPGVDRSPAVQNQQQVIQEQLDFVESQHEALREAYLKQEHTNVDLHRKIREQTMFRDITVRLSSTLDQDAVIQIGLEAITRDLPYDRAMITRYDAARQIASQAHVKGVSDELGRVNTNESIGDTRKVDKKGEHDLDKFVEPCEDPAESLQTPE